VTDIHASGVNLTVNNSGKVFSITESYELDDRFETDEELTAFVRARREALAAVIEEVNGGLIAQAQQKAAATPPTTGADGGGQVQMSEGVTPKEGTFKFPSTSSVSKMRFVKRAEELTVAEAPELDADELWVWDDREKVEKGGKAYSIGRVTFKKNAGKDFDQSIAWVRGSDSGKVEVALTKEFTQWIEVERKVAARTAAAAGSPPADAPFPSDGDNDGVPF